jgi:hypothetical protein
MKNHITKLFIGLVALVAFNCADNTLDEEPFDDNFPFHLVLDAEEGGDIPHAEDYAVELKFADYLPDLDLPNTTITLAYEITDVAVDMVGIVSIDKIIYEVEVDDCVYERELDFTASADGLSGVITIPPDPDLGSVPESFEIVFVLPGSEDTEGGFKVEFSNLQSSENLLLGSPNVFEYSILDNDVAGEWELEIETEEDFERFKEVFGPLNSELESLNFEDITGKLTAEFEFEEMRFVLELVETEEVTTCEDGETETEIENKVIEIEAAYDEEDSEVEFEGSHEIINDEGLVEDELDFIAEAGYDRDDETLVITFFSIIDEDNYKEGEELFSAEEGVIFSFKKD